jgi:hypothetical protein
LFATKPPSGAAMRPVKAAERDVFAARQGTGHHTKNLAGSVATSFDRTLAALIASGSKPQPRGEVLLGPPLGQIRTNFADELQNAVLAMGGQCRQILGATDLRENLPQIRDIRRIDARPRARFSCLCRSGGWRRLRVLLVRCSSESARKSIQCCQALSDP